MSENGAESSVEETHESGITEEVSDERAVALAAKIAAEGLIDIQYNASYLRDETEHDDIVAFEIEQKLKQVKQRIERIEKIIEARPTNFPEDK